eukprot:PITA_14850
MANLIKKFELELTLIIAEPEQCDSGSNLIGFHTEKVDLSRLLDFTQNPTDLRIFQDIRIVGIATFPLDFVMYKSEELVFNKEHQSFYVLRYASPLLVGFTDSDWVGDADDWKSTAGYVFTLGSGPITWACKKQSAISLPLAEVECCGAIEASKEALWLRQILSEFGF